MELPDPGEVAGVRGDADLLVLELDYLGRASDSLAEVATAVWRGEAQQAFAAVLAECRGQLATVAQAARDAGADASLLLTDMLQAEATARTVEDIDTVLNVVGVGPLVLPLGRAAGWVGRGAMRVVVGTAAEAARAAVQRAVARVAGRVALRASLRQLTLGAVSRVVAPAVLDVGLQQLLVGDVDSRETAQAAALGLLLPPGHGLGRELSVAERARQALGRDLSLRNHEGRQLGHTLTKHIVRDEQHLLDRLLLEGLDASTGSRVRGTPSGRGAPCSSRTWTSSRRGRLGATRGGWR